MPVTLCVPENITPERKRMLQRLWAELVLTDPLEGSDGAIREARRRFAADPDAYFYPDQYNKRSTGGRTTTRPRPEIWEQTEGRVTHFVAGLGTSGTFVGTGRRLRELLPEWCWPRCSPTSPLHGTRRPQAHGVGDRAGHLRPAARRRRSRVSTPKRRTR